MAKILIVDDEPMIARAHSHSLRTAGHQCAIAENSERALAILEQQQMELLLSDIKMPGKSGLDLVRRASKDHPDLAIIIASGVNDPHIAELASKRGIYGYLTKPIDRNTLLISVAGALQRRDLEIANRTEKLDMEIKLSEQRAQLYKATEELKEMERKLDSYCGQTVQRFVQLIELRAHEGSMHNQRVSRYCEILAKNLAIDSNRCADIRMASQLHDIGKLGIPDHILFKTDKLSAEEDRILKSHTEIGYRILSGSDVPLLELAATIAKTHHESFDGKGYPSGLASEAIPIEGRIVAIADGFDNITSKSSDGKYTSIEEAIHSMRSERGLRYDPTLVDLFLDVRREAWAIRQQYSDHPTRNR